MTDLTAAPLTGDVVQPTEPDPSKPAFSLARGAGAMAFLQKLQIQAALGSVIKEKVVQRALVDFNAEIAAREIFVDAFLARRRTDEAVALVRYVTPRLMKTLETLEETVVRSPVASSQPNLAHLVQGTLTVYLLRSLPGGTLGEEDLVAAVAEALAGKREQV